jgi:hypothetical protein
VFFFATANKEPKEYSKYVEAGDTFRNVAVFALSFAMLRMKKLQIAEYWSTNLILKTPFFGKIMSRDFYK